MLGCLPDVMHLIYGCQEPAQEVDVEPVHCKGRSSNSKSTKSVPPAYTIGDPRMVGRSRIAQTAAEQKHFVSLKAQTQQQQQQQQQHQYLWPGVAVARQELVHNHLSVSLFMKHAYQYLFA